MLAMTNWTYGLFFLSVKIYFAIFIYLFTCFVCVVLCVCSHAIVYMYRSHDKLCELVLSVCHVGSRDPTQVVRCGAKFLYSLNHLTGPVWLLLIIDDGALRL